MNTIQSQWEAFRRMVVLKGASAAQLDNLRLAFYAGAEGFRRINWNIGEETMTEEAGVAILAGLDEELKAFGVELNNRSAQRGLKSAEDCNGKPAKKHLVRGIELLADHLSQTLVQAPDLADLFVELGEIPQPPNVLEFRSNKQKEPDTLATAIAAYFTEHPDRPDSDLRRDNVGAWPTPWVKTQTEQALLLIAQSMHEFLVSRGPE